MKEQLTRIAFIQRILPYYRLDFYNEVSSINQPFHLTVFSQAGLDKVNNIKTIMDSDLHNSIQTGKLSWRQVKNIYIYKWRLLWQTGVLSDILKNRYDVVMLSNCMAHVFYWIIIGACKIKKIKIVFWSHGLQGHETGLKLKLKSWYLKLADVNLVYANYNKEFMLEAGIKESAIHVVYNALNIEQQLSLFNQMNDSDIDALKNRSLKYPQLKTVLFVSRLEPKKKLDQLLYAFHLLQTRNLFFNLIIVGEGSEREKLLQISNEKNLIDHIFFAGPIYDEIQLSKFFAIADVFVSPGNVGLNCIHSLTYGVPVITHDDFRFQNPEVEAIENGVTGALFMRNNVEDLANKIAWWLSEKNKCDNIELCQNRIKNHYTAHRQASLVINGILQ